MLLSVSPVPSVCVNVVSPSAPKVTTALSELKVKSSPTVRSPCTLRSTTLNDAKTSVTIALLPPPSNETTFVSPFGIVTAAPPPEPCFIRILYGPELPLSVVAFLIIHLVVMMRLN